MPTVPPDRCALHRSLVPTAAVLVMALALVLGAGAPVHATQTVILRYEVSAPPISSRATVEGLPAATAVQAPPPAQTTPTAQPTGERRHLPVRVAPQAAPTAQATGHRRFKPLRVSKRVDALSPYLEQAYKTGRPLPALVIESRSPSGQMLRYKLTNVMVSSYQTSGQTSSAAGGSGNYDTMEVESISLTYQKIDHE